MSGLKVLQKEEASLGFFLLIEGGRIDHVSVSLFCLQLKEQNLSNHLFLIYESFGYSLWEYMELLQANHDSASIVQMIVGANCRQITTVLQRELLLKLWHLREQFK